MPGRTRLAAPSANAPADAPAAPTTAGCWPPPAPTSPRSGRTCSTPSTPGPSPPAPTWRPGGGAPPIPPTCDGRRSTAGSAVRPAAPTVPTPDSPHHVPGRGGPAPAPPVAPTRNGTRSPPISSPGPGPPCGGSARSTTSGPPPRHPPRRHRGGSWPPPVVLSRRDRPTTSTGWPRVTENGPRRRRTQSPEGQAPTTDGRTVLRPASARMP